MRAVVITGYGGLERLELRDVETPTPQKSEVLIRVKATSVNPLDWKLRSGMMRFVWPLKFPFVPGFDVAGVVESVGSNVTRFRVGESVFAGLSNGGGYAEYASVDESLCCSIPEELSFEEAASYPVAASSALQALRKVAKVSVGDHVLINGAAGGVGSFAVQIATALDCKVTAVTSTRNLEFVQSLGADQVIDYTKDDLFQYQPYDVFFDIVPNQSFLKSCNSLTPTGVYVTTLPGLGPFLWNIIANTGRLLGNRKLCKWLMLKPNGHDLEYISQMAAEGKLRATRDNTFSLEDIRDAQKQSEGGHTRGKIVIRMM